MGGVRKSGKKSLGVKCGKEKINGQEGPEEQKVSLGGKKKEKRTQEKAKEKKKKKK